MKWSSIHEFEASSQHVEGRRRETKIMFAEKLSKYSDSVKTNLEKRAAAAEKGVLACAKIIAYFA